MKKLKSLFSNASSNSHKQVDDDIDQIKPPSSESSVTIDVNLKFEGIPRELLINIGSFMVAKDISHLALGSKYYLKFFFNMTNAVPIKSIQEMDETNVEQEKIEFADVQTSIWKPLVLMYFPKFHVDLNVKNWLHVLKRRITHIVQKSPEMLPLGRTVLFPLKETPFVEACEFIYKCPMDFSAMPIVDEEIITDPEEMGQIESKPVYNGIGIPPPPSNLKNVKREVRFCSGCNSRVYQISTAKEMTFRSEKKQCVFFRVDILHPPPPMYEMMLGGPPPPQFFNLPPVTIPPPPPPFA